MAQAPLLQLSGIGLGFGGNPLLEGLDMNVQPGDRVALVGRNGSGKSDPDENHGRVWWNLTPAPALCRRACRSGIWNRIRILRVLPHLGDYAMQSLGPVRAMACGYCCRRAGIRPPELEPARKPLAGSAAAPHLRGCWPKAPDLMLLDEPTNHLDITAIHWLEERLREDARGFSCSSAMTARFLRALTRADPGGWIVGKCAAAKRALTVRGVARQESGPKRRCPPQAELARSRPKRAGRSKVYMPAASATRVGCARWPICAPSARARSSGRARRRWRLTQPPPLGKLVAELDSVSKSYGDRTILSRFLFGVMRGECVAMIGPNGVGKTTLVAPDDRAGRGRPQARSGWAPTCKRRSLTRPARSSIRIRHCGEPDGAIR